MTAIVVGFVDRPEGHAALERAIAEASRHGVRLVVAHGRPEAAGIGGGRVPDPDDSAANLTLALADVTVDYEVVDIAVGDSYADALVALFAKEPRTFTGQALIDEDFLRSEGVTDFARYRSDPAIEPPRVGFDFKFRAG